MRAELFPLQVLILSVSGWVTRHQREVIEYLLEENRVMKEQMGKRRTVVNPPVTTQPGGGIIVVPLPPWMASASPLTTKFCAVADEVVSARKRAI